MYVRFFFAFFFVIFVLLSYLWGGGYDFWTYSCERDSSGRAEAGEEVREAHDEDSEGAGADSPTAADAPKRTYGARGARRAARPNSI